MLITFRTINLNYQLNKCIYTTEKNKQEWISKRYDTQDVTSTRHSIANINIKVENTLTQLKTKH